MDITQLVEASRARTESDRLRVWAALAAGSVAICGATFARHPLPQMILGGAAVGAGVYARGTDRRVRLGSQLAASTDQIALGAIARAYAQALTPSQLPGLSLPQAAPGPLAQPEWWGDVVGYPTVLIYGQFGSGKTTLAERLVNDRRAAGHAVKILDPHAAAGAWPGCETVGSGMDYESIDRALLDFAAEVKRRYTILATDSGASFQPICYVCDEFTHWSDRTKGAADFFAATMADTRKIKMFALFVGHGRTLTCVGGKAGLAKTRDDSLLEVKLFAKPDPSSPTGVSPTGFGELKYPGNPEMIAISIDRWMPTLAPSPQPAPVAMPAPGDGRAAAMAWLDSCWDAPIEVGHETIQDTPHNQQILDAILAALKGRTDWLSAAQIRKLARPLQRIETEILTNILDDGALLKELEVDRSGSVAKYRAANRPSP